MEATFSIEIIDSTKEEPKRPWDRDIDKGPLANKAKGLNDEMTYAEYSYYIQERLEMGDQQIVKELNQLINYGVTLRKLRLFCNCGNQSHGIIIRNLIEPHILKEIAEEDLKQQQQTQMIQNRYKSRQVDGVWW